MFLDKYYSKVDAKIQFTRQQGSGFAKEIADDFNPLHDPDAKLFCVPGDLLFAIALARYGLSQRMRFIFTGMVGDGVALNFPETAPDTFAITDDNDKKYVDIQREGEISKESQLITDLTRSYVEFSGHAFPNILVPLMSDNRIMINPARPMVIYQSMAINLDRLDISNPTLEFTDSTLELNGKKGDAQLNFSVKTAGEIVGTGHKRMTLRGLREFDQNLVNKMVDGYNAHKQEYFG